MDAYTQHLAVLKQKLYIQNLRITFYGASVTQQSSGYVPQFRRKSVDQSVEQIGVGSVHLKEATFLLQTLIINRTPHPHVCVLEWFTSSWNIESDDLNYLVITLLNHGVLPVFLLMYNNVDREERTTAKQVYRFVSERFCIPLIDVDGFVQDKNLFSVDLFRDKTHLTDAGGVFFGNMIHDVFASIGPIETIRKQLTFVGYCSESTKSKESGNALVKNLAYCAPLPIELDKSLSGRLVAIWTIAGPDSGVIRISNARGEEEFMSIFDEWSYYNRFMIRRFKSEWWLRDSLTIALTEKLPDYSTCRRDGIVWPERRLWVIGWTVEQ
jgi:hypothetical protein